MATPEARRSIVVDIESWGYPPDAERTNTLSLSANPVWTVKRFPGFSKIPRIVHAWSRVEGVQGFQTCCRERLIGVTHAPEGSVVNCIYCILCKGCITCKDGMITMDTMRLGHWETRNRRKLFPYEMDDLHLCNAIRALKREGDRYKKNWEDWLIVLEAEAKLRGLSW